MYIDEFHSRTRCTCKTVFVSSAILKGFTAQLGQRTSVCLFLPGGVGVRMSEFGCKLSLSRIPILSFLDLFLSLEYVLPRFRHVLSSSLLLASSTSPPAEPPSPSFPGVHAPASAAFHHPDSLAPRPLRCSYQNLASPPSCPPHPLQLLSLPHPDPAVLSPDTPTKSSFPAPPVLLYSHPRPPRCSPPSCSPVLARSVVRAEAALARAGGCKADSRGDGWGGRRARGGRGGAGSL